jgi:hypothetical protein
VGLGSSEPKRVGAGLIRSSYAPGNRRARCRPDRAGWMNEINASWTESGRARVEEYIRVSKTGGPHYSPPLPLEQYRPQKSHYQSH